MRNGGVSGGVEPVNATSRVPDRSETLPNKAGTPRSLSLKKPNRTSLAEHVRHELIASMIDGRLPPRTRITEMQIAEEMGISRNPVREALAVLIDQGMLQRGNLGLEVRAHGIETFREIFAVRRALEVLAVEIIMSRLDWMSLEALDDVLRRMDASTDSPEALLRLDVLFHETLCRISGNSCLLSVFQDLSIRLQVAVQVDHSRYVDTRMIVMQHAELIDALRSGDAARAIEAIKRHIGTADDFTMGDPNLGAETDPSALSRPEGARQATT